MPRYNYWAKVVLLVFHWMKVALFFYQWQRLSNGLKTRAICFRSLPFTSVPPPWFSAHRNDICAHDFHFRIASRTISHMVHHFHESELTVVPCVWQRALFGVWVQQNSQSLQQNVSRQCTENIWNWSRTRWEHHSLLVEGTPLGGLLESLRWCLLKGQPLEG